MRRVRRDEERGLTAVYLALSITCVMLAGAFAVDLGWWYVRAQHAQRAADAAALAGVVWMPGDFSRATATARESAKANGFEHGVGNISVEVSPGANSRQLAVRITDGNVARFFSSLASSDKVSIGRRAVAQYELPVPLGGPENQFGANRPTGIYLAVNGFCTRRSDGDFLSSAYYHVSNPAATISCPAAPYASASVAPPLAKNPDYRATGYSYVVSIPPAQTSGCSVAAPPAACSRTASPVTIQVQDPKLNTNLSAPVADQYTFPNHVSCGTNRPGTTSFSVYSDNGTPLDDRDNVRLAGPFAHGTETGTSTTWEDLFTVPAGSLSGRYFVQVSSAADQPCSAWSNAFGIRARVGSTFVPCSTLPGSPLPGGYAFCPQVYGLDAMGLRVALTDASAVCVGNKVSPGNLCTTFFLAQVDPVYAGRQMVITLFDPGEGAQRMRVLAPRSGFPNGVPIGFSYRTTDTGSTSSGSVTAGSSGLDVSAAAPGSTFNDRKLELAVTLPTAADLGANGSWFKVEYEVGSTGSSLTDRTTWGVAIRGAPVRLVA